MSMPIGGCTPAKREPEERFVAPRRPVPPASLLAPPPPMVGVVVGDSPAVRRVDVAGFLPAAEPVVRAKRAAATAAVAAAVDASGGAPEVAAAIVAPQRDLPALGRAMFEVRKGAHRSIADGLAAVRKNLDILPGARYALGKIVALEPGVSRAAVERSEGHALALTELFAHAAYSAAEAALNEGHVSALPSGPRWVGDPNAPSVLSLEGARKARGPVMLAPGSAQRGMTRR